MAGFMDKKGLVDASVADLYALYLYVMGDYNKAFGKGEYPKGLVGSRLRAIEAELNIRAYGYDYVEEKPSANIKGDKPEDIDLSKFEKGNK